MAIRILLFSILPLSFLVSRPASGTVVEWISETAYDFGDIPQKKPAKHDFTFRNISGEPLVIDNVRPSCGCTVPDWDRAAVPPDSTGVISIEYDARDQGYFFKKAKVYFHGQRRAEVLSIEGWVE